MTHRTYAFCLSLLVAASFGVATSSCVDVEADPADGKGLALVQPAPVALDPAAGLPAQIGEFCLVTGCAAPTMAKGDQACLDAVGLTPDLPLGCCIADVCWRGFRFGPTCAGVGPGDPAETCPSDANGDGACSYQEHWYTRC